MLLGSFRARTQIFQSGDVDVVEISATGPLAIGARVRVRRERWRVVRVQTFPDCALVSLAGIGRTNFGNERTIVTPADDVEPVTPTRRLRLVTRTQWQHACRNLMANAGPLGILRSAQRARMDLLPHQLEPALAVMRGDGSRVLIADDVGLGKTIQAALVVSELLACGAARRVLVITPAGLREQWLEELRDRFDLHFAIVDVAMLARSRASLPIGMNPWIAQPLALTSLDFIKRPEILPSAVDARWDVMVVDEAHHAASATERHSAVAALAARAPFVVLLTATPHDGDAQAFASLCRLGGHGDDLLAFRRTRREVGAGSERRVRQLRVRLNANERKMHACLDTFVRAVEREASASDADVRLAIETLRKRAFSSAFALERSVSRRLERLGAEGADTTSYQLELPFDASCGEFDDTDAAPVWRIPALSDPRRERALLTTLADAARKAARRESKLSALARLIRRTREPLLVFTEYRDTLTHVRDQVAPDAPIIHGGLSRDERRAALTAFPAARLLLATDAAGEGLNLQRACRTVVNLELPWNPMRLEQRIGRVDRIGQARRVHAVHLIAHATGEARVLQRLRERLARADRVVGVPNVLGDAERPAAPEFASASPMLFRRLTAEAAAEHTRLTRARTWATPFASGPSLSEDGDALMTYTPRRSSRIALGGRALVICGRRFADGDGACAAWDPFALLVPRSVVARAPLRTVVIDDLAKLGERLSAVEASEWLETCRTVAVRFWTRAADREAAIAAVRWAGILRRCQPGLFDRRVIDAHDASARQFEDAQTESRYRIEMAARHSGAEALPLGVALILVP